MRKYKVIDEHAVFEINGDIHIIDVNSVCEIEQLESEELCLEAFLKMSNEEIIKSCSSFRRDAIYNGASELFLDLNETEESTAFKNDPVYFEAVRRWDMFFEDIKSKYYNS